MTYSNTLLKGKTALITGGSSGIGLATAKAFLAAGARVAITARKADKLEDAKSELGGDVVTYVSDASKVDDLDALMARVKDDLGGLDILFANAGVGIFTPFAEIGEDTFDYIFDINVKGVFFTVQKVLPLLNKGASVIMTASTAAHLGFPGSTAYAASKNAVHSLARTLSAELIDADIRVNTVAPGGTSTNYAAEMGIDAEAQADFYAEQGAATPLGRFSTPEEIADAVLFLASDASYFMRGTEILIDGGTSRINVPPLARRTA